MSLDTVELILDVEKHFDIKVSDEVAWEIETVGQFTEAIRRILEEDGRPMPEHRIFVRLRAILVFRNAIPEEKVVRGASFVEDLGMD